MFSGGRSGIRTHGDPKTSTAFEAVPFVRSGILPSMEAIGKVGEGDGDGKVSADERRRIPLRDERTLRCAHPRHVGFDGSRPQSS